MSAEKLALLLTDDCGEMAETIHETLRADGYLIVTARTVEASLDLVSSLARTIDVVIVDRNLPGKGEAFVEQFRERGCWVPVLMISGNAFVPSTVPGVNAVIARGFGHADLRTGIMLAARSPAYG